jgi:hypothetical protein
MRPQSYQKCFYSIHLLPLITTVYPEVLKEMAHRAYRFVEKIMNMICAA